MALARAMCCPCIPAKAEYISGTPAAGFLRGGPQVCDELYIPVVGSNLLLLLTGAVLHHSPLWALSLCWGNYQYYPHSPS